MFKKIMIYLVCLIFMFFSFTFLSAEGFHVTNGNEFQDALTDAADNGEDDIIYMSSGVYYRTNEDGDRYANFEFNGEDSRSLTIIGEAGASSSDIIIDAYGSGFCLNIRDRSFETDDDLNQEFHVSGITFQNGNTAECSAGLHIYAPLRSVIVNDCVIRNNITYLYSGGGVKVVATHAYIENNKILYNTCYDLREYGEVFDVYGGGLYLSAPYDSYLRNNIIAYNSAISETGEVVTYGGGIYISCNNTAPESLSLINNTIYGNSADEGGGIYFIGIGGPRLNLYNNIIYNNTANSSGGGDDIYAWYNYSFPGHIPTRIYAYHNNYLDFVYGEIEESVNNLDLDPDFVNARSGNFHLSMGSPMISAGTDSVPIPPGLPDYDFEGDPRIGGTTIDIGADEYTLTINVQKPFKARIIVMDIVGPEIRIEDVKKIKVKGEVFNPEYKDKGEIWVFQVSKDGIKYYSKNNKWTDKKSAFYQGEIDKKFEFEIDNFNISKSGFYNLYVVVDKEVDDEITPDSETSIEEETIMIVEDEQQQIKQ